MSKKEREKLTILDKKKRKSFLVPNPITKKDGVIELILTPEIWEGLQTCNTQEAEITYLADKFHFTKWKEDLFKSIQLTMYHDYYRFTYDQKFSQSEAAIFFQLMKATLDKWSESSYRINTALHDFRKMILSFVNHDETDQPLISLEKCGKIVEYVTKTVFQHFQLYQFVFTKDQQINLVACQKKLELPIAFEPLTEAKFAPTIAEIEAVAIIEKENWDYFNSSLDIFEALSPVEVKQITYDIVVTMFEGIQKECERLVGEHRQKVAVTNSKNVNNQK
ncbi:hypothetical protein BC833DRAFT_579804 [Globomyces pollinis-pini]|nr:hypothetical protein BC833DRAFT_579804 [Globomyces pollinis-pini]